MGFSLVVESKGYSPVVVLGLLIAVASLTHCEVQALGCACLSSCGSRALEHRSIVVAQGLGGLLRWC